MDFFKFSLVFLWCGVQNSKISQMTKLLLIIGLATTPIFTQSDSTIETSSISIESGSTETTNALETTTSSQILVDKEIITSPGYPESYLPDTTFTVVRTVDDGYQIDVLIEDLDLDSTQGDFLLIRAGEDEHDEQNQIILYGSTNIQKTFRTASNLVYISFVVQERVDPNPVKFRGFKLQLSKAGSLETTTTPTTTEQSIPVQHREYITVYLIGTLPEDFVKTKVSYFIDILVRMAKQFCAEENITVENDITHKNIDLKQVSYCPITWPNYRDCIEIKFAIPISFTSTIKSTNETTYQLNSLQLSSMWNRYSKEMLKEIGMEERNIPNFTANLWIWFGFFIIFIAFFCGFLFYLWKNEYFSIRPVSARRMSDSQPMEEDFDKPRFSDTSLYPSQHQLVPPLFDTPGQPLTFVDEDFLNKHNSFQLYEPDFIAANNLNQQDLLFNPPPSFATEQEFGVINNMGFIHDDENVLFERSTNGRKNQRNVSFKTAVIHDSKL